MSSNFTAAVTILRGEMKHQVFRTEGGFYASPQGALWASLGCCRRLSETKSPWWRQGGAGRCWEDALGSLAAVRLLPFKNTSATRTFGKRLGSALSSTHIKSFKCNFNRGTE